MSTVFETFEDLGDTNVDAVDPLRSLEEIRRIEFRLDNGSVDSFVDPFNGFVPTLELGVLRASSSGFASLRRETLADDSRDRPGLEGGEKELNVLPVS